MENTERSPITVVCGPYLPLSVFRQKKTRLVCSFMSLRVLDTPVTMVYQLTKCLTSAACSFPARPVSRRSEPYNSLRFPKAGCKDINWIYVFCTRNPVFVSIEVHATRTHARALKLFSPVYFHTLSVQWWHCLGFAAGILRINTNGVFCF